ncbi:vesicle coat protein [Radiomyces spectabilis]|uniref:vesicle coat protein n=1 Tax=Radiomyces spectabilis TaxID=64574 RepID=UPI00221EF316|nr:vesicle coat protein [Radiomyces spectabilis]KAI8371536.1 vesicle coat protein [Radiomyces spectabilis]
MNALIALLHFCEVHGPCVVFCTQAIHTSMATGPTQGDRTTINIPHAECKPSEAFPSASFSSTFSTSTEPLTPPNTSTSPRLQSPPSISSLRKAACSLPPKSISNLLSTQAACSACTAQLPFLPRDTDGTPQEVKTLLTRDEEDPSVQYIGTKSPQQLHLYKAVRLACVRSLTTEFCPGRDGPVLFGDDENGYVMSYMFKLRDSQARGEARFYSLMMLMTDRVYLVSCWPFLMSAFRSMAINLQERADHVFQKEKAAKERQPAYYSIVNSRRVAPISQDQFFRRRSNTSLRSLVDLLGVKDIYVQVHVQFSYILRLSARRRMEKFTPGRTAGPQYQKLQEEYEARKNQRKTNQDNSACHV